MSKLACVVALAVTASLGAANMAAASEVSARIYYSDLDLASPQGAKVMLQRIKATVASLCAPSNSPVMARGQSPAETADCRAKAMQRAVASLDAPMVTAEYDHGSGGVTVAAAH